MQKGLARSWIVALRIRVRCSNGVI